MKKAFAAMLALSAVLSLWSCKDRGHTESSDATTTPAVTETTDTAETVTVTETVSVTPVTTVSEPPEIITSEPVTTDETVIITEPVTTASLPPATTPPEPPVTNAPITTELPVTTIPAETTTPSVTTAPPVTTALPVTTELPIPPEPAEFDFENTDLSQYVRLGKYKGLEVFVSGLVEVDDSMVESTVERLIGSLPDDAMIYDKAASSGDKVNISFVGSIDGIPFDGGSADDYDLTIGSDTMIDGFEESLVGVMPGNTATFALAFSEDYYEEVAGKEAVFEITLNYIYPTLTDELSAQYFGIDSTQALREAIRAELETKVNASLEDEKMIAVWTAVLSNSRVVDHPEELLAEEYGRAVDEYIAMAESYGVTYEALFTEIYGLSMDEAEAMITESAKIAVSERLILYSIARDMGLDISDAAFADAMNSRVAELGYASVDELVNSLGISKQEFKEQLLYEQVLTAVMQQAVFVTDTK